jgi:hypothetical protein
MSICIKESGLLFGDYNADNVFHIEKSQIYEGLDDCSKTVEFVLRFNANKIYFIEAKNSSPQPCNKKDFNTFINEISGKIEHSMDIFFALIVKRMKDTKGEFPCPFQHIDYSTINISAFLIINGHKTEWLPPIKDALTKRLKRIIKTWNIQVAVLNHELAGEYGLTKGIMQGDCGARRQIC